MRYWQTSLFPFAIAELSALPGKALSPRVMSARCDVASRTPVPDTNLFLIETQGCSFRRVYLDYPEFEDWFRLERGGFVDTEIAGFGYVLDALH